MSQISIPADSATLVLNGTPIVDFMEGDNITMTPVNPVTEQANSSNGGVSIQERTDKDVHDMVLRVQKFSPADVFLNNARNQSPPVIFGGSKKDNYVKDSTDSVGSWFLDGGSITAQPTDVNNNQEGNNLMEYTIRFRNATRSL